MTSGFKLPYHNSCYNRDGDLACKHLQNRIYCMLKNPPKGAGAPDCERIDLTTYYGHTNYLNGSFESRKRRRSACSKT